jgi:hypothetical protein
MGPRKTSKSKARPGSLLSPEAMGGINALKGFDFQTRFAACHVPVWLLQSAFHQIFYEGTGDIDVRFRGQDGQSTRVHFQVKDHELSPAEFRKSLAHFRELDRALPGVYKCFTLVSPSLSPKLRPIESALARFHDAQPFYDDPASTAPTKQDVDDRLRSAELDDDAIAFVHACLRFEIGHGDLQHDGRAAETFVARLLKHPDYADRLLAAVQPAFAELLRTLHAKRGQVLNRADIDQMLRSAVATLAPGEKGATLWMQNWTREAFDIPAEYTIDWSQHFDRSTRRVPPPHVWNNDLLPELKALRERMQSEHTERLIRFRGKCPLSSGVALGAAFPAVGGWVFEMPQPPAKELWRSDAEPSADYQLAIELADGGGDDLVLGLNIRGDGREDVRRYIAEGGIPPKLLAFMAPSSTGSQAIAGDREACAFARAVRERLGELLKTHAIRRTCLFVYGPLALAVFLGQQLTSVGTIELFEYQEPGYVPSCTLST